MNKNFQAKSVCFVLHRTEWMWCSVLGPSLQEGHWGAGACLEKGYEAGESSREQVWDVAEGAGAVQSGEEEAEGGTLLLSTTTWKEGVARWGLVSSPS